MLTTDKFYTTEELIKKIQSTNIKLKPNFEIISQVNNVKALQRYPLIIILGEEHISDIDSESYYLKDLEKLEKISNTLEIRNIFLEGVAKGEEKNIEKTILNAEVNLIKNLSKNTKYNIYGVENLDIQIKMLELGFLSYYGLYLELVNNSFSTFFNDNELYNEIRIIFKNIFEYVYENLSKNLKGDKIHFKTSMKLYLALKERKINYSEVFEKVEIYYINMLLHLNGLTIYPKTHNEFHFEAVKITKKSGFNLNTDKNKIEKIHFKIISNLRDELFTKNILESMKENNISKSIFVCGYSHMKNVKDLIRENSKKIIGTEVNIILIDIT